MKKRDETFFFSERRMWRLNRNGQLIEPLALRIHEFWFGFPKNRKLDAAYERKYDGSIIFFSGTRVYRFTGTKLAPGYPKDIYEEFIIPKNTKMPKRIDAGNTNQLDQLF